MLRVASAAWRCAAAGVPGRPQGQALAESIAFRGCLPQAVAAAGWSWRCAATSSSSSSSPTPAAADTSSPATSAAPQASSSPLSENWTPAFSALATNGKGKRMTKRVKHLMNTLHNEWVGRSQAQRQYPDFKAGDVLEVRIIVPENRRREYTVKGICIARMNKGLATSFTIRNIVGGFPIERTLPLYSPHVLSINILERRKVRRAKLYYLREQSPKFSRI
eukprot:jgi/Chlat1/8670/Chrsp87S08049